LVIWDTPTSSAVAIGGSGTVGVGAKLVTLNVPEAFTGRSYPRTVTTIRTLVRCEVGT
jgi:hypothetical protein